MMAVKNELYKCEICGNVVSIVEAGPGELVCCGQEMNILTAKTEDEGKEALKNSIPVMGCRDQAASNYDYTATLDDGSCSYTEEGSNMMPLLIMGGIAAVVLLM